MVIMSESGNASSNRNTLIGAAVAVVVAAVGGYQVGFGNGEEGLIEAQKQVTDVLETSKTQAAKIDEQTQAAAAQAKEIEAKVAEIAAQTANVDKLTADIEKLTADLAQANSDNEQLAAEKGRLSERVIAIGSELNDTKASVSELTTQIASLKTQNEQYLETIAEGLDNQRFTLTIGGPHKALIKSSWEVGLSYVSREDKMARVTLGGEQLELELQSAERIRIDGKSCALNLTNLISDDEAAFEVTCD